MEVKLVLVAPQQPRARGGINWDTCCGKLNAQLDEIKDATQDDSSKRSSSSRGSIAAAETLHTHTHTKAHSKLPTQHCESAAQEEAT